MSKLGLIINREYTSRVKKKSFLILTILVPIIIVGFLFGAMWLSLKQDEQVKVLVADPGGWCGNEIYQDSLSNAPAIFYFYNDYVGSAQEFMEDKKFKKYDMLVMLNEKVPSNRRVAVVYKKQPSLKVKTYIQNRIESRLREYFALKKTNLTKQQYYEIQQPFGFKFIDGEDPTGEDQSTERASLGFGFAIIIYMFIFLYAMQVMRGVIEEKTNRVVEVIISSVKPFELMMGKIIGIGLVGLTQFLIWIVIAGAGLYFIRTFVFTDIVNPENWDVNAMANGVIQTQTETLSKSSAIADFIFNQVNWPLMLMSFFFYFIGGFLLYSAILAAIGSMVDSETDTQQLILPVTMPLILSYVVASTLITNPASEIGTWFSIIPFTSPIVMMVKVSLGTVALWQYILSITLLFGTFIGITWLAAKIYRTGILMYGKKASWKEVLKWIKYK
jgi:ABC-2 type transport system permease protein